MSRDEGCGRKRPVAIVIVHTFVSDFFLCELVRGLQVLVLLFFVVMSTLSSSPFSIEVSAQRKLCFFFRALENNSEVFYRLLKRLSSSFE